MTKKNNETLSLKSLNVFDASEIHITNIQNNVVFSFLKKVGDSVLVNEPIMQSEDGQKILCGISGVVTKIVSLKNFNEIYKTMIISNDYKNTSIEKSKFVVNNHNLIELCKEYGLINANMPIYKLLANINDEIIISAYDKDDLFLNKSLYVFEEYKIDRAIEKLKEIFKINEVKISVNKKDKKLINFLRDKGYNLIFDYNFENCLGFIDLVNIYNLIFLNVGQTEHYVQFLGGALKQNCVVKTVLGVGLEHIFEKLGGFKTDIELFNDYREIAKASLYDIYCVKQKIKKCRNKEEKIALKKQLKEVKIKSKEVFSKFSEFRKIYYDSFNKAFVNCDSNNSFKKFDNLFLQSNIFSVHFNSNIQNL